MAKQKICLKSLNEIKDFCSILSEEKEDYDLISGRRVVDAKSFLGITALDMTQNVFLTCAGQIPTPLKRKISNYCY